MNRQGEHGSWMRHPAITALAAAALLNLPGELPPAAEAAVERGLDFICGFARRDGSIWNRRSGEYPNYTTAISLIALTAAGREQDRPLVRAARDYLLNSQFSDVPGTDPGYGGIGYGKTLRPDLSNTQWALEALHMTDHLDREPFTDAPERAERSDQVWQKACNFLSRCQNLPEVNDRPWVARDADNRGGFVYSPFESKAGTEMDGDRETLRSYGSMTYAGLKSMIYARVERDDPRVTAAIDWIRRHFTFDSHPGLGQQGLYYYLHTCAKSLDAYGADTLMDSQDRQREWREELAGKLVELQREDGSWFNDNGRWMESIPELATSYAMLALETALGKPLTPAGGGR